MPFLLSSNFREFVCHILLDQLESSDHDEQCLKDILNHLIGDDM